jgi:excinuclease ABC subunit A
MGGRLLFEGTPRALARVRASATGAELARRQAREEPPASGETGRGRGGRLVAFRRAEGAISVVGARQHNLRDLTVRFPLGRLVSVSGVSGSGKSTLVRDVLFNSYARRVKGMTALDVGEHDRVEGLENVADILFVDQSPLGRSARSNPVTYMKAWDDIRQLFARSGRAISRGITARDFSFNSEGGRCETCKGTGWQTIDMQFLADVTVRCETCDGRRFQGRVLSVRYRGRNIGDVLDMTVSDAVRFFSEEPRIGKRLGPLVEVGLGYVKLGQPTATLSGGEAQRLKLASFLEIRPATARGTLFLFDEPTTGLHAKDVDRLLGTLRRLITLGHSVIAVEHNLQFLEASDWIVDLGPGGGRDGGRLVAEGSPEDLRRSPSSITGRFLAEIGSKPADTPSPVRRPSTAPGKDR